MKQIKLLPHSFQRIGWVLLLPFLALGIANMFFEYNASWLQFKINNNSSLEFFSSHNFTDEVSAVGLIISLIFIAFSKEKIEDEDKFLGLHCEFDDLENRLNKLENILNKIRLYSCVT